MILYKSNKFNKTRKIIYFKTLLITVFFISKQLYEYIINKKLLPFLEGLLNFEKSLLSKFLGLMILAFIIYFLVENLSLETSLYLLLSPEGPYIFTNLVLYAGLLTLPFFMLISLKYIYSFMQNLMFILSILVICMITVLVFSLFFLLIKDSEKIIRRKKINKKIIEFQSFDIIDCIEFIIK